MGPFARYRPAFIGCLFLAGFVAIATLGSHPPAPFQPKTQNEHSQSDAVDD